MNERPVSATSKRKGVWDRIIDQAKKAVERIKNEQDRRTAAESEVDRLARRLGYTRARQSHFERVVRKRRIKARMERQSRRINRRNRRSK